MINPGTYRAKIVEYAFGRSKGGHDQVGVALAIYQGRTDEEEGTYLGTETWYGYLSDGTFEITTRDLRTMGWRSDDITDLDPIVGSEIEVVIREEFYEGKAILKVAYINPVGGGGVRMANRLDESEKEALKNRVRARLALSGKAPAETKRSKKKDAEPPAFAPDDDIPF